MTIVIDGAYGEGGGQILRTALSLSLVTGTPFVIEKIRSKRSRPGLMRQHLTAVCAAAEVGDAGMKGAEIGSTSLLFTPKTIRTGRFRFAVGTAGSATLVLQTVLPALLLGKGTSQLTLEGGTHNPYAPPFDFLNRAFLPLINKMGAKVEATLKRPGFYPAGGGLFEVTVTPVEKLDGLELIERGDALGSEAIAQVSALPQGIGERELSTLERALPAPTMKARVETVRNARGPGNVLMVALSYENVTALFTGFGERRVKAETVAERTAKQVKRYLASGVPVGHYLADQLLVPLALAGDGRFRTVTPSRHTLTNIEIIKKFLDVAVTVAPIAEDCVEIEIKGR